MTASAEERRARAAAEAAEWAYRLDTGPLSEAERAEFVDWLRESRLHVAEMCRIDSLTAELSTFGGWDRIAPLDGRAKDAAVVSLDAYRAASEPIPNPRRARILRYAGIAAAFALVAVSGVFVARQLAGTILHTQAGESRTVTLDDGSVVRLLPNTDLHLHFRRRLRFVVMDRGQAIFHVAKDSSRPFVVDAARTQVKAVGTVFSVQRNAESVVVAVAEGRVEVRSTVSVVQDPARTPVFASVALQANERIAVSARGIAGPIRHVDAETTDAWAEDQLIFENARVEDVVARFNRQNQIQIRITDSELASRTVSGVFDGDDPRSFVDFLETIAPATSNTNGSAEIVVTPSSAERLPRPETH